MKVPSPGNRVFADVILPVQRHQVKMRSNWIRVSSKPAVRRGNFAQRRKPCDHKSRDWATGPQAKVLCKQQSTRERQDWIFPGKWVWDELRECFR